MASSTTGERITAVVSVLVSIAMLGAVVTAQQGRRFDGDDLVRLESDLRFQLDLNARFDRTAHKARLAQLESVLQAWRQSMQSSADRQLLVAWFKAAIAQTITNSAAKLPPPPDFGAQPPLIVASPPPASEPQATSEATEPPSPELAPAAPPDVSSELVSSSDGAPPDEASPNESEPPAPTPPAGEHSITQLGPPPTEGLPYFTEGDQNASVEDVEAPLPPVQVNLAELAARIRGFHHSLDGIEASLVAEAPLPAERLEAIVTRLESLAVQHRFLRLYYDALTVAERRLVEQPRSMADTIRFAAAQPAAGSADDDFLSDFAAAESDMPTLAQRLAALAKQFAPTEDAAKDGAAETPQ
jgi:hypothetical protein